MKISYRNRADGPFYTPLQKIRVVQGEDKLKFYADSNTAAGVVLNRYFCSECGSNIFLRSPGTGNDVGIIALGTLDDEVAWSECLF